MKKFYLALATLVAIASLFTSCSTVNRLLERCEFQAAYELAYRRANKTPDRLMRVGAPRYEQFIAAYAAVQAYDLSEANDLAARPGTAKYDPLFERYDQLLNRSEDILRLAPTAARFDHYRDLAPDRLFQQREAARLAAGAHYLALVNEELPAARTGDKPSARRAFELHDNIAYFLPERTAELTPQRDSLRDIGTLRVWLMAEEGYHHGLLIDYLSRREPRAEGWTEVTTRPAAGDRIDREVALAIGELSVRDYGITSSTEEHEKEILDYVEKKKEKVKINDTTWVEKIVEIEHYKKIYASITTYEQRIDARLDGELAFYPPGAYEAEFLRPLGATYRWSHEYVRITGNPKALTFCPIEGDPRTPPAEATIREETVKDIIRRAEAYILERYRTTPAPHDHALN